MNSRMMTYPASLDTFFFAAGTYGILILPAFCMKPLRPSRLRCDSFRRLSETWLTPSKLSWNLPTGNNCARVRWVRL